MPLEGSCHCGNLGYALHTQKLTTDLPLRACQCSFCRAHGVRTITDPQGRAEISVRDEANLSRYQFGLATAEFFVCRTCGVYLAAVMDGAFCVLNANALRDRDRAALESRAPEPVSYEGESAADRIARRRERWTPCQVSITGSTPR